MEKPALPRRESRRTFGECAVVDIGAGYHASRRNDLSWITALHDQRKPFHELLLVGGVFHAVVEVMGRESMRSVF